MRKYRVETGVLSPGTEQPGTLAHALQHCAVQAPEPSVSWSIAPPQLPWDLLPRRPRKIGAHQIEQIWLPQGPSPGLLLYRYRVFCWGFMLCYEV